MKAIQVKYLPATNTKGIRIRAFVKENSITESRKYGVELNEQSRNLAQELMDKLEWNCKITGAGVIPNGDYVFTID
jgi:hypothetical protein